MTCEHDFCTAFSNTGHRFQAGFPIFKDQRRRESWHPHQCVPNHNGFPRDHSCRTSGMARKLDHLRIHPVVIQMHPIREQDFRGKRLQRLLHQLLGKVAQHLPAYALCIERTGGLMFQQWQVRRMERNRCPQLLCKKRCIFDVVKMGMGQQNQPRNRYKTRARLNYPPAKHKLNILPNQLSAGTEARPEYSKPQ